MDAPLYYYDDSPSEHGVRQLVRSEIGYALTTAALAEAMRVHTPDTYRQAVLKDGVSSLSLVAGRVFR